MQTIKEDKTKLSVCISAYDRHDLTVAHVKGCMDVSRVPDEIIVVNDGGDPSLKDMLKDIPRKCPLVYAHILEDIPWNYHGAVNLCVWLSRGDLLAFEDNDNIPTYDFYNFAMNILREKPSVGRVRAKRRIVVSLEDMLTKDKKDWIPIKKMGSNNGTAIIRREIYLQVKGQDEQFCGRYGWMYYDWRSRLMKVCEFDEIGEYFYTRDGQSGVGQEEKKYRRNDPINFGHYRRNCRGTTNQSPIGILNFSFIYERFPRNTE